MALTDATKIWFERMEARIVGALKDGAMPFLGLYTDVFRENARGFLAKLLASQRDALSGYVYGLSRWPAVFATYLTVHVVEGYGQSPTPEVYEYVERAVTGGTRTLSQSQKERLCVAYRQACVRLGLSVSLRRSGTNFMVDEYLRQAGVPLRYAGELAGRMAEYARVAGVPDDDDPNAIRLWQRGLLEQLRHFPSKRATRAIEADDTGFYVRLFCRAYQEPDSQEVHNSAFGRLLAEVLTTPQTRPSGEGQKRLSLPHVVWRDGSLGVDLPPAEGTNWVIRVGATEYRYQGFAEGRFVHLEENLPSDVSIQTSEGQDILSERLWEDGRPNRLLIFTRSGAFVTGAALGAPDTVAVEPGAHLLVLRFVPDGLEELIERVSDTPELFTYEAEFDPGATLVLRRGPATATLQADARPFVAIEGRAVRGVRGHEVYLSPELALRVVVPVELLQAAANFEVRLIPGDLGDEAVLPLDHIQSHSRIDLSEHLARWRPGVTRLLAEVRRQDLRRPLARAAVHVWNGLEEVRERCWFRCSGFPQNLSDEASENLHVDRQTRTLTYRDNANRFFRTGFNLGHQGTLTLTWAVPGIFLYLEDYSQQPVVERPLHKGVALSVTPATRQVLKVYSSSDGALELGGFRQWVKFEQVGSRRLHLASLVEHVRPDSSTLMFRPEGVDYGVPLVQLIVPHQVLRFNAVQKPERFDLVFRLAASADRIRLAAIELIGGQDIRVDLGCDDISVLQDPSAKAWTFSAPEPDGVAYTLVVPLDRWAPGIWMVSLDARISGRWGTLTNARGDTYSAGFLLGAGGRSGSRMEADAWLDGLNDDQALEVLTRVHSFVLVCHAQEAWSQMGWVGDFWRRLVGRFGPQGGSVLQELGRLSGQHPPETASLSWVPLLSIPVALPWLLAQSSSSYSVLADAPTRPTSGQSGLTRSLGLLPAFSGDLLRLFTDGILDSIFAGAFSNLAGMARGEKPQGFRVQALHDALKVSDLSGRWRLLRQEDWQPGRGDYLGALHYHFALAHLRERYQNSLEGNELRRTRSLYLLNRLNHCALDDFGEGYPAHLCGQHATLGLLADAGPSLLTDEELQQQENLHAMVSFLSLMAQVCRWEVRAAGTLDQFQAALRRAAGFSEDDLHSVVAYLLHLGEEVLGYYLLLWELAFASEN